MSRTPPTLDVVILSWNRRDLILETIANVQQQRDVHATIWVIDQGSDEETLQALRPLHEADAIHLLEMGHNLGVAAGRNVGNTQGDAPIIVSLDNDAVFESDHALQRIVSLFHENKRLGAVGFRLKNYFTNEDDWLNWAYPRRLFEKRAERFLTTRFAGGAHALRRAAWEQTRGYDPRLFFNWEELDLGYQLIAAGWQVAYDPRVVVRHKIAPDARLNWRDGRYYYLVRNALYLNYKYFRSRRAVVRLAVGYMLKGAYNGLLGEALRALRDASPMMNAVRVEDFPPLNEVARRYIAENDGTAQRGGLLQRLRHEVFARLP